MKVRFNKIAGIVLLGAGGGLVLSGVLAMVAGFDQATAGMLAWPGLSLWTSFHAASLYAPLYLVLTGILAWQGRLVPRTFILLTLGFVPAALFGLTLRLMFTDVSASPMPGVLVQMYGLTGGIVLSAAMSLLSFGVLSLGPLLLSRPQGASGAGRPTGAGEAGSARDTVTPGETLLRPETVAVHSFRQGVSGLLEPRKPLQKEFPDLDDLGADEDDGFEVDLDQPRRTTSAGVKTPSAMGSGPGAADEGPMAVYFSKEGFISDFPPKNNPRYDVVVDDDGEPLDAGEAELTAEVSSPAVSGLVAAAPGPAEPALPSASFYRGAGRKPAKSGWNEALEAGRRETDEEEADGDVNGRVRSMPAPEARAEAARVLPKAAGSAAPGGAGAGVIPLPGPVEEVAVDEVAFEDDDLGDEALADGSGADGSMADLSDSDGALDEEVLSEEDLADDGLPDEGLSEEGLYRVEGDEPDPDEVDTRLLPPMPAHVSATPGAYRVPVKGLLDEPENHEYWLIDEATTRSAHVLKMTLEEFGIQAEVTGIRKGPVITMFEILPAPGVKLAKIVTLADNIALRLAAQTVRIVAPIPGKHAVGIEIPNKERAKVSFAELLASDAFTSGKYEIPVAIGKDITGEAQIIDLCKTPHLLIAGSTGSGKSVCVNALIASILYRRSPAEVNLILVDPKIVELKFYNDIPHLLTPVITDPKKAFQALQWCLYEMERRYSLLDAMKVREIKAYNKKVKAMNIATPHMPYLVVIIDEFADLMATSGKELEGTLARLAAMSRAVGIHLVLATQRPSTDVITGLIKANIPSRIAFMVASKIDSRIILDSMGAEKLLGRGDMLFTSTASPFPTRIQGAFLSDDEVERVVTHVKTLGKPDYIDDEIFFDSEDDEDAMGDDDYDGGEDPLMRSAIEIVVSAKKASASYLQRRLKIGYNRAARLVEKMEEIGVVGPAQGSKPREILRMFQ